MRAKTLAFATILAVAGIATGGCSRGSIAGGAIGGTAGAVVGGTTGAVVGGTAGAIIGDDRKR